MACGRHEVESIRHGLETSLGAERAGFHLRELILRLWRETGWIEHSLRGLKYPDKLAVWIRSNGRLAGEFYNLLVRAYFESGRAGDRSDKE